MPCIGSCISISSARRIALVDGLKSEIHRICFRKLECDPSGKQMKKQEWTHIEALSTQISQSKLQKYNLELKLQTELLRTMVQARISWDA